MHIIRVVLADDHSLARKGMRTILKSDPTFDIVGEATNAAEVVRSADQLNPDLILMDLRMPGGGLNATREIKKNRPHIKIVVVTVSDDPRDLFEAIRCGAQGYLLKNLSPHEWIAYLRSIMDGKTPISHSLSSRILMEMVSGRQASTSMSSEETLTQREREVLRYVAKGLTNKEIAQALHISENTVKNHLKNMLTKLKLLNRTQLTRFAMKRGLLPLD